MRTTPVVWRRLFSLLLLGLFVVVLAACQGGAAPAASAYATACGDLQHPARRATYDNRVQLDWTHTNPFIPHDVLELDDASGGTDSGSGDVQLAHAYARQADIYYRDLARAGYGTWNGCYGKRAEPVMVSRTGYEDNTTSWQSNTDDVVFQTDRVTPESVAHEWAHGLVVATTGLSSQGPQQVTGATRVGETGALFEALGDIFASLVTGNDVISDGKSLQRSMASPTVGLNSDYVYMGSDLCHFELDSKMRVTDQIANQCKYINMGIPVKAANLLMTPGVHEYGQPAVSVKGIGRPKTGRIFMQALDSRLSSTASFADFATNAAAACYSLAGRASEQQRGAEGVSAADCIEVERAFMAVGINKTGAPRASASVVTPTVRPRTPTPTPARQLMEREKCTYYADQLNIDNLTRQTVRLGDVLCTGCPPYRITWEEDTIEPGEKWSVGGIDCHPCTIGLSVEGKPPLTFTLPGPRQGYCYRITLHDADFR